MGNMYMSPLLRNRVQTSNPVPFNTGADLNAVYENLKLHAGDAKPNEAKAKLINDNFAVRTIDAIKDTGKDCKNYFKAIKTGDVNDNQIGRINDVGVKLGAGLIAAFLALNTKNKKMALMELVGGATFLATMKLWPKLFINMPAKLVHGFDIDKKYISAQGEKKDFFLDNQFLPWDVYSKEELAKIGNKMGIDINSPNGEEKIKRKMQKTALQNRTLWMATAGFATPIGTSLACGAMEPYIEKGLAKSAFNKVDNILKSENGLENLVTKGQLEKLLSKSQSELDKIFEGKATSALGDSFFGKLASRFDISGSSSEYISDALKGLYEEKAILDKEGLVGALQKLNVKGKFKAIDIDSLESLASASSKTVKKISKEQAEEMIRGLGGQPLTIKNVREMLKGYSDKEIGEVLEKIGVNNEEFFKSVKEFNSEFLVGAKARFSKFAKLFEPFIGKNSATMFDIEYKDAMKKLVKEMESSGIKIGDLASGKMSSGFPEALQKFFEAKADNPEACAELIGKLFKENKTSGRLAECVNKLTGAAGTFSESEIAKGSKFESLVGAIFKKGNIAKKARTLLEQRKTDVEMFKTKPALLLGIERRIKDGTLRKAFEKDGLVGGKYSIEKLIELARKAVYDSNSSNVANKFGMSVSKWENLQVFYLIQKHIAKN